MTSGKPTGSRPGQPSKSEARAARAARVEEMRRAAQAKERRRSAIIWGTASVAILAIIGVVSGSIIIEHRSRPDLTAVVSSNPPRNHVTTPVSYESTPPAGGDHAPVWLNCVAYDAPVKNENAVHSLEHGAVWITYRPDLSADKVTQLRQTAPGTYAIVSPYQGLPSPIVVSAWGKQLRLDDASDPRLKAFIREYRMSPNAPEPGAACTGGTDGSGNGGGMGM